MQSFHICHLTQCPKAIVRHTWFFKRKKNTSIHSSRIGPSNNLSVEEKSKACWKFTFLEFSNPLWVAIWSFDGPYLLLKFGHIFARRSYDVGQGSKGKYFGRDFGLLCTSLTLKIKNLILPYSLFCRVSEQLEFLTSLPWCSQKEVRFSPCI